MPTPLENTPEHRPVLTGWRTRVVVVLLALSPFVVLEVALRIAGYGQDKFTNFVPNSKVYRVKGDRVLRDPVHGGLFRTRPFTVRKSPGTSRIFVVGDSMTYGFTYHGDSAVRADPIYLPKPYSTLLEERLEQERPDRRFEVLNCGGLGHASYRLKGVLREVIRFSPDLVVVMTGSSEFLEARTYKDWQAIRNRHVAFLRDWRTLTLLRDLLRVVQAGDADHRQGVDDRTSPAREIPVTSDDEIRGRYEVEAQLAHSTHNLEEMIAACREAGVPLVLCTVPSDLTHPPHFRGEAPPESALPVFEGNSEFSRDRFESMLLDAARGGAGSFGRTAAGIRALIRQGDPEGAVRAADAVIPELGNDLRVGVLHYLRGMALMELARFREAREALKRARDLDLIPIRCTGEFNDAIRDRCAEPDAYLADVEQAFERNAPHGIPDHSLFYDSCHPVPEGHRIIAETILSVLERHGLAAE